MKKLEGNVTRDKAHQRALRKLGWLTVVIWEYETEKPARLECFARQLAKRLGLRR